MTSDSFYRIGKSHETCQDYAVSDSSAQAVWAICSDGCSGAAHSDIGARLLTHTMSGQIRHLGDTDLSPNVADVVERVAPRIFPSEEALFASLLGVRKVRSRSSLEGFVSGDGVLGFETKDNKIVIFLVESPPVPTGSAPFYPAYFVREDHLKNYLQQVGDLTAQVRLVVLDPEASDASRVVLRYEDLPSLDGEVSVGESRFRYRQAARISLMELYGDCVQLSVQAEQVRIAAAFSDGVLTGELKQAPKLNEPHPRYGLLLDLFRFNRQPQGNFLKRRAHRACSIWDHQDDLAGAMVVDD